MLASTLKITDPSAGLLTFKRAAPGGAQAEYICIESLADPLIITDRILVRTSEKGNRSVPSSYVRTYNVKREKVVVGTDGKPISISADLTIRIPGPSVFDSVYIANIGSNLLSLVEDIGAASSVSGSGNTYPMHDTFVQAIQVGEV